MCICFIIFKLINDFVGAVPPEVHLNEDYLAVRRGSGTVLRCTVRGDLPLSIQWRKDGIPIDPSVQPR